MLLLYPPHEQASHQCWEDLRPRQYAAADSSTCRPVPKEQACLQMAGYTPTPGLAPLAAAVVAAVAIAIGVACALRSCCSWQKRSGFVEVGSGEQT